MPNNLINQITVIPFLCTPVMAPVLFFSVGSKPHSNEIAGSDLDGDKYFVCWDKNFIPPTTIEPTSYRGNLLHLLQAISVLNAYTFHFAITHI